MELKIDFTENTIYVWSRINSIEKKLILDTGMFIPVVKNIKSSNESKILTLNGIINGEIKDSEVSLGNGMTIRQKVFHTTQWDEPCDGVMPFSIIEKWLNCIDFQKRVIKKINNYDKSTAIDIDNDPIFIDFNIVLDNKKYIARLDTGSPNSFMKKELARDHGLLLTKSGLEDSSGKEFLKLENSKHFMFGDKKNINATASFLIIETPIDFRKKIDFLIGNDILSTFKSFSVIRNKKKLCFQI